jgi:tyrosyl-tRNA synthetase
VELGGTDQKFNLLCGCELQRQYGQKPQIVLMTPILEGLDGVQKMSKSLGNAIGINEPPAEMYGKLMSINDELMWKYFVYLTDLKQSEVDELRVSAAAGSVHPMELKKRLARSIVGDFHSQEEAARADENWARMFQQNAFSEEVETIQLPRTSFLPESIPEREQMRSDAAFPQSAGPYQLLKVAKLLTAAGFTTSNAEAQRKLMEGAVQIDGTVHTLPTMALKAAAPGNEVSLQIRLGKKAKVVILS